ncbi:hypothetical protein DVH24_030091, partial [Malus domestica]
VTQVVRRLDRAFKEAGFLYVNLTRKFFELPYEEKLNIKMSADSGYSVCVICIKRRLDSPWRRYQREDITKGEPDMHEAFDVLTCMKLLIAIKKWNQGCMEILKNQWKDLTNGTYKLRPSLLNISIRSSIYFVYLSRLQKGFCFSVPSNASALSGSPYEFEGDRAGDAFWVMRLIGYPGLLTLVSQDDDITALQVRNLSDEWISAPPVLGTFVCNIGDMLKTNFDTAVEPWTFAERRQAELRNSKELFMANIWLRKY